MIHNGLFVRDVDSSNINKFAPTRIRTVRCAETFVRCEDSPAANLAGRLIILRLSAGGRHSLTPKAAWVHQRDASVPSRLHASILIVK